ncbi:MAG: type II secretion system F family protein [Parvibaculum sp.]|uniref:type II secretion system F family protein n=1 Tax=Parvibaculum sp. TaxID=2024848 RepID=UPI0025FA63A7|nr:type II secretion system F family protein [Parvibaculum sp.]MCE9650331.1 type II secretion system F family protein [Parvibaculum sp.]
MLQAISIVGSLLCLAGGVYAFAMWRRQYVVLEMRDRLAALTQAGPAQAPVARRNILPEIERVLPAMLRRRLLQAGTHIDPTRLSLMAFGLAAAWIALVLVSGVLVAIVVCAVVLLAAFAIVDHLASRRMNALSACMSGFLDRVRQLLIVGNSLSVALARATQGSPPILVEFFSPTIRRIANGAGVAERVNQLADEIDLHELRLLGAAIETNLRFGGSLAAVLSNLIENIRRRSAVDREVRSNTSQIRASAWILALLPLVACAAVMVKNPDYVRYFIDTTTGNKLLIYAACSELVGAFLMRSIVRVNY